MNLFAIGFVLGAWLLQQQSALPSIYVYSAILPMAFFAFRFAKTQGDLTKNSVRKTAVPHTQKQNISIQHAQIVNAKNSVIFTG